MKLKLSIYCIVLDYMLPLDFIVDKVVENSRVNQHKKITQSYKPNHN